MRAIVINERNYQADPAAALKSMFGLALTAPK